MTMEEALAVVQKIADAWNAFGQAMETSHRRSRICFVA